MLFQEKFGNHDVYDTNRVTRLGEFLPNGRMFPFGSLCENYRSSTNFWGTLSHRKIYVLIVSNKGLGYIFGAFSLTHLVTLDTNKD
jgi:hypothetical protein